MMIDLRETHIFVGQPAQPLHSRLQAKLPASNFSQKFPNVVLIHNIFWLPAFDNRELAAFAF